MTILELKNILDKANGQPRFCSFTYLSKKHSELARYTLLLNASYRNICQEDILELTIRLGNARGIEKFVIESLIDSLQESIRAIDEGRDHINYTKAGLYTSICPGLKVALNDMTCEIQGLQHAKVVITPGEYKVVKHRSEETRLKAEIRKELKIGKFKTLCCDLGNMQSARINGEVLEFN